MARLRRGGDGVAGALSALAVASAHTDMPSPIAADAGARARGCPALVTRVRALRRAPARVAPCARTLPPRCAGGGDCGVHAIVQ